MTRVFIFNRIRPNGCTLGKRCLAAIGMALCLIAALALPARADDVPGGKAPAEKAPPVKAVWYKPAEADKILTDKGLKKLKTKGTAAIAWVLPDDGKVAEKMADFAKVAAANRAAEKNAKQVSKEIATEKDTLDKAQTRYSELKGYADKPETIPRQLTTRFRSQQEMMQALQTDLNSQIETINKLQPKLQGQFAGDMPPPLKRAIIAWMLARNNLILACNGAKPDFGPLDKQYHDLAEDPDVAAALRSLGKRNHLGSSGFEQVHKSMAEAEAVATSGEVPFYRTGAVDTVGAILNETSPVAILIQSVNPNTPNWAPADLLAKAGIAVDPASPEEQLSFSGNGKRVVKAHLVVVPKLRFGKYVLENLKFLAMPDDAKDLGLEISSNELKAYDQSPDRDTWLYKFEKKAEPASDDVKPADAKPSDAKPSDSKPAEK